MAATPKSINRRIRNLEADIGETRRIRVMKRWSDSVERRKVREMEQSGRIEPRSGALWRLYNGAPLEPGDGDVLRTMIAEAEQRS